jgi:phage terminase Nu1 subunit (DNA packaging protein)
MRVSGKGKIVRQGDLAEIFGVTSATIRAWRRAGCPVEQEGGSGRPSLFNTMRCIQWHEGLIAGETADVDLAEAKRRKTVAEACLREIEVETARDALLPRIDVHAAVTSSFARVRSRLLSMPTKLAPLVLGLSSLPAVEDKLSVGVNEALAELAGTVVAGTPIEGETDEAALSHLDHLRRSPEMEA